MSSAAPIPLLLWALLALWAVALVAAFAFGRPSPDGTRRSIPWMQRSTSLLLAVMAGLFWVGAARGTPLSPYAGFVALGMAVSFVADLIMAEIIRLPNRVLGGIAVFGVAHLLYIAAFLAAGRTFDVALREIGGGVPVGVLAFAFAVWLLAVRAADAPRALNYAALVYAVLICTMAGLALALALAEARFAMLAAGALLFVLSDIILGNHILRRNNWRLVGEVVWFTYISGQALIVWTSAVIVPYN